MRRDPTAEDPVGLVVTMLFLIAVVVAMVLWDAFRF